MVQDHMVLNHMVQDHIIGSKSHKSKRHLAPAYVHFGSTSWSEHGLKMTLCRFYQWSNQGIIMLSKNASRSVHIY